MINDHGGEFLFRWGGDFLPRVQRPSMSALHRSVLKRKLGRRDLHDAQSEYNYVNLMDRQREEPSASAESSGAPMEPPAERLASANAGSSNQQLDGTEGVEPEGAVERQGLLPHSKTCRHARARGG